MKKLLFLTSLFITCFSLKGQGVLELQILPMCWEYTTGADSTIYAYWLMSSRNPEPRLMSYLNVSGTEVSGVSSTNLSSGLCCCGSSGGGGDDGVGYRLVIASNGLNDFNPDPDSVDVELGGTLERVTVVDGDGSTYPLSFYNMQAFRISSHSGVDSSLVYVLPEDIILQARQGDDLQRMDIGTASGNPGRINITNVSDDRAATILTDRPGQISIGVSDQSDNESVGFTASLEDGTAKIKLQTRNAGSSLVDAGMVPIAQDSTGWVEFGAMADNHLGTDDQTLTGNRTTDFENFTYTWDLTGASLDQVVHPVLAPDGRVYGWYVEDGAGEMSWLASEVLSTGYDRMIFHNLADRLEVGGISDSTFINADKLFFNIQNLDTDNTLTKVLARDQVTGEAKEVDVSSFGGGETESAAAQFIAPKDTLVFDNDYYYQPRIFPDGGLTYTVDTTGSKYGTTIMAKVQSDTLPILFDLQWFDTTQMYNIRSGDTLTGTHNVYFEYTPYGVAVSVPTNSGFAASNDTTSTPPSNFTLAEGYPSTVGVLEFELDGRFNIRESGDTVFWKSTVDTLDYFYNDVVGRKPDIITNGLLLDADDWLEAGPTAPFTHNTDPDGYSITYAVNPSNSNYSVITRAANETDRVLAKNGNTDYCGSVIFTGQGGTAGLKVVTIDIPPTGTARLYINGVEVSTDTTVGGDARNATFDRIGRMVFEDFYLDGEIKYLGLNRFTTSGISPTEAQNLFIHINERILNEAL